MVRKISTIIICVGLVLCFALQAHAANYTVYDNGTLSTTYTTYFRDILSGTSINQNYVAFRSGQYSYTMIVGDLNYNNGNFSCDGVSKVYEFSTTSQNYNSNYKYEVSEIDSLSLKVTDEIIYSDMGEYPQLIERGDKYETLTAVIICVALLCIVINRIFNKR